ncbi:hypothetical protein [Myxosarcina sp. GI1]|uniref:hypothetical protein n=1 Tax=Myxosarcina sp. GI1 TaxID=1541065 RepID=UPI0005617E8E|nr:hypothetical protein [Myxosarcina sp. GI1]
MLHSEPVQQDRQMQRSEASTNIAEAGKPDFNIFRELEYLQTLIMNGTHVPLTELVVLDRQSLLDCLEIIKRNLPSQLAIAIDMSERQEEIVRQTEIYVENMVSAAEAKAAEIVEESTVVRKAELAAAKLKLKTERECEQMRQMALTEYQEILAGADSYADGVLGNIEQQLNDMLSVVKNGRQQLSEEQLLTEDREAESGNKQEEI